MQTSIMSVGAAHPDSYVTFNVKLSDAPDDVGISCVPIAGHCGPTPYPSVDWSPCPAYHEEIEGVDRSLQAYRLNCAAATPLSPDQTETFQMKLWVPPGTRSGVYVMRWSLDDPAFGSPFARALVTITP